MLANTKVMVALIGTTAVTATALGGIVDLRDLPGNFDQFTLGQPNTQLFAQGLTADVNGIFDEFRVRLASSSAQDILFNIIVTGSRNDGGGGLGRAPDFSDIRYNSGQQSADNGLPWTEVTVFPNIPVTNGEQLFVVLDTFSYPGSGAGLVRATEFNGDDQYLPGEFVFINASGNEGSLQDFDNVVWSHRFDNGEDLAIFASFVPAPGALGLLALGGLIGRRRRRD